MSSLHIMSQSPLFNRNMNIFYVRYTTNSDNWHRDSWHIQKTECFVSEIASFCVISMMLDGMRGIRITAYYTWCYRCSCLRTMSTIWRHFTSRWGNPNSRIDVVYEKWINQPGKHLANDDSPHSYHRVWIQFNISIQFVVGKSSSYILILYHENNADGKKSKWLLKTGACLEQAMFIRTGLTRWKSHL